MSPRSSVSKFQYFFSPDKRDRTGRVETHNSNVRCTLYISYDLVLTSRPPAVFCRDPSATGIPLVALIVPLVLVKDLSIQ
jgi:hypothetical protein